MTYDIIEANGFIFLYSFDRVLVFYENDGAINPRGSIAFDDPVEYGKFNPLFYNPRLYTGSINFMAFHSGVDKLYIVKPSLEILVINVNYPQEHVFSNSDITFSYNPFDDDTHIGTDFDSASFKPLNGTNILKIDSDNNRLYWVNIAHDAEENSVGNFHYRKRFLGLYNIDPFTGEMIFHDYEVIKAKDDYYESSISDIVFNEISGSEYYYISKLNQIEVRKWSTPLVNVELFQYDIDGSDYFTEDATFYKFSKLLYINEGGCHKIIALPYRYPSSSPKEGVEADFISLNGNHTSTIVLADFNRYAVPSQRITDAAFISGNSDLILSYAPDDNEVTYHNQLEFDHDIVAYHYENGVFIKTQTLRTNQTVATSDFDINASLRLLPIDNTTLLISKKDEILKLHDDDNNSVYTVSDVKVAENSLFGNGVTVNGKSFISNLASNGFEAINHVNLNHSFSQTGYPAYHITGDADMDKLLFYNKWNNSGAGLYACDIDYENNTETVTKINLGIDYLNNAIGDCIYNPYTDHFLIAERSNDDVSSRIIVINNDNNNSLNSTIELPADIIYPGEMFIAPDKKLYVFANMIETKQPKVLIYSATETSIYTEYEFITSIYIGTFGGEYAFYSGFFCYNPYDETVYASIHPKSITLDPYLTANNSMHSDVPPYDFGSGKFFSIADNQIQQSFNSLSHPQKIICPSGVENSQYENKMFIIGEKLYVYDYIDNELSEYAQRFNDIIYCPLQDEIYALNDHYDENEGSNDRIANIHKICYSGGIIDYDEIIAGFPGQAASLLYNKFDGNVYLYHKFDQFKLGGSQVKLISFNPADDPIEVVEEDLGLVSFYPEYDHCPDFHYHFYNLTTPLINPHNNTIYLPNGGHSCVSKVSFDADETLLLNNEEWAWLSFPRLERDNEDPSVHEVLYGTNGERIDPLGYIQNSELQNKIIGSYFDVSNVFDGDEWPISGQGFHTVNSIPGYKIYLNYGGSQPEQVWLHMSGDVIDPEDAYVDLPGDDEDENWLGYYLYQEQFPPDALSEDDREHVFFMKGQYWACAKHYKDETPPTPFWVCKCAFSNSTRLKYGDMAIIKSDQPITNFRWHVNGLPPTDNRDRGETENYTFTEQADYTPIFIEMDSTVNPLEVGAFVEDSCVGATSVFSDDTLIMVPAYTEGISGEVYFESYYGTAKSDAPPISEYFVKDKKSIKYEKRMIHTAERQDYYFVSFKKQHDNKPDYPGDQSWIKCRPNPMKSSASISFHLPADTYIEIRLYDIFGKERAIIHKGILSRGTHEFTYNGLNNNGMPLANGTYILSLKSADDQAQTKVIIIK